MQRILVVEDDFDIQELLQNFLQEAGYEVAVANDGVEALSLFAGQRYDLIVLDIMLPKIDGYGVCEVIRQKSINRQQYFAPALTKCCMSPPHSASSGGEKVLHDDLRKHCMARQESTALTCLKQPFPHPIRYFSRKNTVRMYIVTVSRLRWPDNRFTNT